MQIKAQTAFQNDPVIILHGLFGSSDNWQKVAKSLQKDFPIFLPDLRNHGNSGHSDSMSFEEMAQDIIDFADSLSLKNIILAGHSLGGKVAMKVAELNPSLLKKLVVIDILPVQYKESHSDIINAMKSVDLSVKSKNDINSQLIPKIPELGVRQFIMKNLKRLENGYEWKMNINAIESNYGELISGLTFSNDIKVETLFIRGEKSDYIDLESYYKVRSTFVNSHLETITDSGHWVHAEQPDEFLKRFTKFIS